MALRASLPRAAFWAALLVFRSTCHCCSTLATTRKALIVTLYKNPGYCYASACEFDVGKPLSRHDERHDLISYFHDLATDSSIPENIRPQFFNRRSQPWQVCLNPPCDIVHVPQRDRGLCRKVEMGITAGLLGGSGCRGSELKMGGGKGISKYCTCSSPALPATYVY